jgi:hypothetical protein
MSRDIIKTTLIEASLITKYYYGMSNGYKAVVNANTV